MTVNHWQFQHDNVRENENGENENGENENYENGNDRADGSLSRNGRWNDKKLYRLFY